MSDDAPFWEQAEQVERFAAREPDRRLVELVEVCPDPARTRVLDLGCAGGRNAEFLASCGFDVYAIDASEAMVAKTRERVAKALGVGAEAAERVRVGRMDDLADFDSGSIQLVVALGVFHLAQSRDEWNRALAETARVLAREGRALVSNFSPRTDPTGRGLTPVAGDAGRFEGFPSGGRHTLLDADDLDREMRRVGLVPEVPTTTVEVAEGPTRRVTVNALYRKS